MYDDSVEYVYAHVKVPSWKWEEIQEDLDELSFLRVRVADYEKRDREYTDWSLNGGMLNAVLAGYQLKEMEGDDWRTITGTLELDRSRG